MMGAQHLKEMMAAEIEWPKGYVFGALGDDWDDSGAISGGDIQIKEDVPDCARSKEESLGKPAVGIPDASLAPFFLIILSFRTFRATHRPPLSPSAISPSIPPPSSPALALTPLPMSSPEEDYDGELSQNAKKRRIQRACDMCRRKKSMHPHSPFC